MFRITTVAVILFATFASTLEGQIRRPRFSVGNRIGRAGYGTVYFGPGGSQVVLSTNVAPFGRAPFIVDMAMPSAQPGVANVGRKSPLSVKGAGDRVYIAASDLLTPDQRLAKTAEEVRKNAKAKAKQYEDVIAKIQTIKAEKNATDWDSVNDWFGTSFSEFAYNYGSRLTLGVDQLREYGRDKVSLEKYGDVAMTMVEAAAKQDPKGPWMELGVYAVANGLEPKPQAFIRLVINKAADIRGELLSFSQDQPKVHKLYGKFDTQTLRVCVSFEAASNSALDTGLFDLIQPQSQALWHQGNATSYLTLARVKK